MKPIKQTLLSGAIILTLSLVFTSCEDILGEWDRPAPNPVVPTPEPTPEPEPELPGLLAGKFSVSATQKVCFSQGNLQYTRSTGVWSFMEHQWSTVETLNQNVGTNYAEQDVVSLFGWGTSGYNHGAIC